MFVCDYYECVQIRNCFVQIHNKEALSAAHFKCVCVCVDFFLLLSVLACAQSRSCVFLCVFLCCQGHTEAELPQCRTIQLHDDIKSVFLSFYLVFSRVWLI